VSAESRFSRRSRSDAAASPLTWTGAGRAPRTSVARCAACSASPATTTCTWSLAGSRSTMPPRSIDRGSRPAASARRHAVLHFRIPPSRTEAAHHSAIITGTGRTRTMCLGRQSVSTRPWASRLLRTPATVPGDPCSRKRRRQGSGHGAGTASAVGWGTSGSRCARTPTASRISSSSGNPTGSIGGVPNRRGASGQGRGTSSRPRPGAAVESTRSARPRRSRPRRSPACGAARLIRRTSSRWIASGSGWRLPVPSGWSVAVSRQADQSVVPPARRCSAQAVTACS
jgi:hypothetical protein